MVKVKSRKVQSISMIFNGKRYGRSARTFLTKEEAKKVAESHRKSGDNVILDKRKDGYFLWMRNKRQVRN